jgi:hypothetical protein
VANPIESRRVVRADHHYAQEANHRRLHPSLKHD